MSHCAAVHVLLLKLSLKRGTPEVGLDEMGVDRQTEQASRPMDDHREIQRQEETRFDGSRDPSIERDMVDHLRSLPGLSTYAIVVPLAVDAHASSQSARHTLATLQI
jgi:hypothetical protein